MATIQDAIQSPAVQDLSSAQLVATKPMLSRANQDLADYGNHWRGGDAMQSVASGAAPAQAVAGDQDAYVNAWASQPQPMAKPGVTAAIQGVAGQAQGMPVAIQGSAADRANSYEGAWNEVAGGKGPALNPDQSAAQSAAQGAGNGSSAVDMLGASGAAPETITNIKAPTMVKAPVMRASSRPSDFENVDIESMPRGTPEEEDAYQSAVRNRDAATNSGGGD